MSSFDKDAAAEKGIRLVAVPFPTSESRIAGWLEQVNTGTLAYLAYPYPSQLTLTLAALTNLEAALRDHAQGAALRTLGGSR